MTNTAPKRNEIQILNDRRRTAELLLQGYTHQEIRDILEAETGISLSRRTITNDVAKIKEDWMQQQQQSVTAWVNQEIDRLDTFESTLWRAYRASCDDEVQETIEKVAKYIEDIDDYELRLKKVTQVIKKGGGVGDVRLLAEIRQNQQERRKLLGLYAPSKLGVDVTNKTEIIVKGYAVRDVSPDAWPAIEDGHVRRNSEHSSDVIDGELVT